LLYCTILFQSQQPGRTGCRRFHLSEAMRLDSPATASKLATLAGSLIPRDSLMQRAARSRSFVDCSTLAGFQLRLFACPGSFSPGGAVVDSFRVALPSLRTPVLRQPASLQRQRLHTGNVTGVIDVSNGLAAQVCLVSKPSRSSECPWHRLSLLRRQIFWRIGSDVAEVGFRSAPDCERRNQR
jgi:hypothetical protein